jgi:hypothetical protein
MFRAIDFVKAPLIVFPLSEIVWRGRCYFRGLARALMSAKKAGMHGK